MGALLEQARRLVKKPNNRDIILFKSGTTEDIIKACLIADQRAAKERVLRRFAQLLRGASDFETCRNVWRFVRFEIPYVKDKAGYERIKLPQKTLWDALQGIGTDCKSMAVLGNALLRELGIDSEFEFISQNSTPKARHVYSLAVLKNGVEVPCDAVYHTFNQRPMQTFRWNYEAVKIKNTVSTEGVQGFNYSSYNFSIL